MLVVSVSGAIIIINILVDQMSIFASKTTSMFQHQINFATAPSFPKSNAFFRHVRGATRQALVSIRRSNLATKFDARITQTSPPLVDALLLLVEFAREFVSIALCTTIRTATRCISIQQRAKHVTIAH